MMFPDSTQTVLITHLVQVSIVAVCAWIVWRLLARNRPHLAHAIWALVLLKCVTPPIVSSPTSPFSWFRQSTERATSIEGGKAKPTGGLDPIMVKAELIESSHPASHHDAPPTNQSATDWKPLARSIPWYLWAAGSLVGVGFIVARYLGFIRRIRKLSVVHNEAAELAMQRLVGILHIRRQVRLLIVDGPIGPAVLGILRPTILIPSVVTQGKTATELEPLIAHELIHVRRGDLWWSLLQSIAKSLWWFHPLVWFSGRMLNHEAERSCDEETVSSLGCAPSVYARSLLDVLEQKHRLQAAPALPGVRPIDITAIRMERIMKLGTGSYKRNPQWVWLVMALSAACLLPGARMVTAQNSAPAVKRDTTVEKESAVVSPPVNIDGDSLLVVYVVNDLLEKLMQDGLSAEQAEQTLLDYLPASSVKPSDGKPADQKPLVNPALPSPKTLSRPTDNTTTRVLNDGRLIVNAKRETHDAIRKNLEHFRKFGFEQVLIKLTVLDVRQDKLLEQAAVKILGTSDQSDAGVEGTLQRLRVLSPLIGPDGIDAWTGDLEQQGIATVLSRPTIVTNNGRAASIHIGSTIPIRWEKAGGGEDVIAESVDVGFKSMVLPKLTGDGDLEVEFELELAEETGDRIRSTTTASDGSTVRSDVPVISKKWLKTNVRTSLDTPVLIGGLVHENREGDEQIAKQLMVLLTCQKLSPLADQYNVQASASQSDGGDTQKADSGKPRDEQSGVVIGNESCAVHISGDVNVVNTGNRSIVSGTGILIRFRDLHLVDGKDFGKVRAEEGKFSFILGDHLEDVLNSFEAELRGNVMVSWDDGGVLQADSLRIKHGEVRWSGHRR
ncbi:M56 family metallopeptidase [Stieleria varia]|uniref:Methicillin resistance mecR1 protein n=1 Tax=Stieleria varia TaxID=2528005 RepID=A0A5C6B3I6_9BACT|nr:M56 family metallopeptidase [Stieleria varia]TWU06317.1 Methicillin resistance mecR1 protein [Stieleria varia]